MNPLAYRGIHRKVFCPKYNFNSPNTWCIGAVGLYGITVRYKNWKVRFQ